MSDIAYDAACIFCRIAAREIPAEILHESDTVVAFRDTNPQAPVHILLIPKEHIASVAEIEDRHGGVLADIDAGRLAPRRTPRASPTAAGAWSRTSVPTPARACSTCTSTCSAAATMAWPPG